MREQTIAFWVALCLLAAAPLAAQPYELSWWTVDAGGLNDGIAGTYRLSTTAGQPDAGGPFASGPFTMHAGFWALVAGGAGGPSADLSATITDGQPTAVPGTTVTYTMTVSNAGPNSVTGVSVFNDTAILLGVAWTCTATVGSSCPASGSGGPNHFVNLAIGGTVTYTLNGQFQTSSTGTYNNTITANVPSGVSDPNAANNSATDTDTLVTTADLDLDLVDSPDPVGPGGLPIVYTITLTNLGPSYSFGSTLTATLPAGVTYSGATAGGIACSHAAGTVTCDLGPFDVGEQISARINVLILETTTGVLNSQATVAGDDLDPVLANNVEAETTTIALTAQGELSHGTRLVEDVSGPNQSARADFYRLRQQPRASYEVVLDGASGDASSSTGIGLDLLESDGITNVWSGQPVGNGHVRSLRWMNTTTSAIDDQYVRVRSTGCLWNCGPDDQYRLRAWETTASIPRFNNSGSQVTVLMLQNTNLNPVFARVYFWDNSGALLFELGLFLQARGFFSTTTGYPQLAGVGGSITIVSDAPYGTLVGKAVALEPSTGFSFDSPLVMRPR